LQGILLELPLASFFLKKLLHMGCDLHDLPSLDAELYKSLLFLRDYDGDTEDLALSFTVTDGALGQNKEVHLKAYLHISFPGSQADCALQGNSISFHTVLLTNQRGAIGLSWLCCPILPRAHHTMKVDGVLQTS